MKKFCEEVADTVMQNEVNGIINICSGRPEKLADRVERFIEENNLNINLKYGAFSDRPYDSKAIWGDDFKIRMIEKMKDTAYENRYSITEFVKTSYAFLITKFTIRKARLIRRPVYIRGKKSFGRL